MKSNIIVLLIALVTLLSGCSVHQPTCKTPTCEDEAEIVVIASTPQNVKSKIFLVNQNTGEYACCQDNEFTTAEECAQALEKECFKRVEDLPHGAAQYDFLTTGTYPTRRWRNNETTPRW